MRSNLTTLAWFAPASILLIAVVGYPVLRTIALSFTHESLATEFHTEFAGIDNFSRLLIDSRLRGTLATTVFFTVVSVGIEFLIGLLLAVSLEKVKRCR